MSLKTRASERLKDSAKAFLLRRGLHVQSLRGSKTLEGLTSLIVARYGVEVVLDVGANRGQYAKRLRTSGYRGRIVSFEPVPATYEVLKAAAENDPLWDVHRLALGSSTGSAAINIATDSTVSSFLEPNDEYVDRYAPGGTIGTDEVQVMRLDGVLDDILGGSGPILLKCDTQGFDLEVLRGATGILDRVVAIQAELSVRPIYHGMIGYLDALREIAALGFTPAGFFPVDADDELRAVEVDGLFVRTGDSASGSRLSS